MAIFSRSETYGILACGRLFTSRNAKRFGRTGRAARLDVGGRSRGAGTAADRTHSEAEDRTPTIGHAAGGAIEANNSKHASITNSNRLAGRGICVERQVLSPGRQAPATCKLQVSLWNYLSFRRESGADEPSLRIFFRARFLAKALFTRRFSPGFK